MLYRKNDAPLDFDFKNVLEQSRENPVYYVQYAHARCYGIYRRVENEFGAAFMDEFNPDAALGLAGLSDAAEIDIIKSLATYKDVLVQASRDHEPHKVAFYLYQLANLLAVYYNKGQDSPELRVIQPTNPALTRQRLVLIHLMRRVLADGLGILGVSAPEELT